MEKQSKKQKFKLKDWGFLAFVVCLVMGLALFVGLYTPKESEVLNNNENVATSAEGVEFAMPVEGELLKDFSDKRLKYNSTLKQWESHKAVDISAKEGSPVVSVLDGTITGIETTHLKGTTVTITHKNGLVTTYSSLGSELSVKLNDQVKKGQQIGVVSLSAKGESNDGPHLHFEVIKDGVKVNPNLYLDFGQK